MAVPVIPQGTKTCVTCKHFDFKTVEGKRKMNRECLYEDKIDTVGGVCQQWKDPRTAKEKLLGKPLRTKAFTR
jgi:hypothetical protein